MVLDKEVAITEKFFHCSDPPPLTYKSINDASFMERKLSDIDLMLNMNALNNAVAIVQMAMQGDEGKPALDEIVEAALKVADRLRAYNKNDRYIMVYLDKKNGSKLSDKKMKFIQEHFEQNEHGGYYARMRESYFGKLLAANNWIFNAFKIRTEEAKLQEAM